MTDKSPEQAEIERLRRHVRALASVNEQLRIRLVGQEGGTGGPGGDRQNPKARKRPGRSRRTVTQRLRRLVEREGGMAGAARSLVKQGPAKLLKKLRSPAPGR